MLAMLLMCVSPLFIFYGQEVRKYPVWTLILLLASAALLRALRISRTAPTLFDQHKLGLAASLKDQIGECVRSVKVRALSDVQRAWLLYDCSSLVAVYTSLSTLSLILVQILYVACVTRLQWSRALYGFIVSLMICLASSLNGVLCGHLNRGQHRFAPRGG